MTFSQTLRSSLSNLRTAAIALSLLAVPSSGCAVYWDGLAGAEDWYSDEEASDESEAADETTDGEEEDEANADDEAIDEDGDGVPWPEDCHDGDAAIFPNAEEHCDSLDNDCNGEVDDATDSDEDGFSLCEDCDDNDADLYPGAPGENDCNDDTPEEAPQEEDTITVLPSQWVAGHLAVDLLTGDPTTDSAISQAVTSLAPPIADGMVVLLEVTPSEQGDDFEMLVGQGTATDSGYSFSTEAVPAASSCSVTGANFSCDIVPALSLALPLGADLHLRDVQVVGGLDASTGTLSTSRIQAAIADDEVPDISTEDGSLADLMADRSFDIDLDGDGAADAWSVALSFTPIAF